MQPGNEKVWRRRREKQDNGWTDHRGGKKGVDKEGNERGGAGETE